MNCCSSLQCPSPESHLVSPVLAVAMQLELLSSLSSAALTLARKDVFSLSGETTWPLGLSMVKQVECVKYQMMMIHGGHPRDGPERCTDGATDEDPNSDAKYSDECDGYGVDSGASLHRAIAAL
ncbi:hypothetical protein Tco_1144066 [Tanacetum coccineum]